MLCLVEGFEKGFRKGNKKVGEMRIKYTYILLNFAHFFLYPFSFQISSKISQPNTVESLPTIKASQLRIMGIKRSKSLANRTKNCYKKSIQQPLKVPDFGPGPINSPPSEKIKKREDACWHNTVVFKSAR